MTKIQRVQVLAFFLVLLAPLAARAATYYVAPTGSDTAAGTLDAPFASWAQAQTAAAAGDTVYFRGGTYKYTDATSTCSSTSATVDSVVLSKSGTSGNMINYWAYQGETPVFDFSGVTDMSKYNCRHVGVRIEGDYLYLKGLEITGTLQLNSDNHESWGLYVMGGSNNTFELLNSHHNMGPGFFIQEGGGNTFLNCDSHENEDTLTSNGDGQSADGFGCHPDKAGDTGNIFHGCRAWWNSDDGWDFIKSQEACTVEYSWSWYHGYKPDALSGGKPVALAAGNGNGFKGGGYDMPPADVPNPIPQHILRFNVSFFNKAAGFYANHSPNSAYFYNNTGYSNNPDFNMLGVGSDDTSSISVGFLRNNLAFGGTLTSNMNLGGLIDDQYNSWDSNMGITVANADFQSVAFAPPASCPAVYSAGGTVCVLPTDTTSFAGMASARQADGSLPVLPFLRLAAGSPEIDKGTTAGLPQPYPAYVGAAPDLGAFEYGASTATAGTSGGTGGAGGGGVGGSGGSTATGGVSGGRGGAASGGTAGGSGGARIGGATGGSGGAVVGGTGGVNSGGTAIAGAPGTGGISVGSGGSRTGGISGGPGGGGGGSAAGGAGGTGIGGTGAVAGGRTGAAGAPGTGGASGGSGSTENTSGGSGGGNTGGETGGAVATSGAGGSPAGSGGSEASGSGGETTTSGSSRASSASSGSSGGCSCRTGGGKAGGDFAAALTMLSLLVAGVRRRRKRAG
ncbi:MAG: right-handed parallel beta-helix repeat-containing protein [Polyangia bacterium]